jgi:hypothetical protein
MTNTEPLRSLIEVQFPIGPLSLESYKERDAKGSKLLSSLGKWWGGKPLVLVRAIVEPDRSCRLGHDPPPLRALDSGRGPERRAARRGHACPRTL